MGRLEAHDEVQTKDSEQIQETQGKDAGLVGRKLRVLTLVSALEI